VITYDTIWGSSTFLEEQRWMHQLLTGLAAVGLVGIAWGDVGRQGGTTLDIAVRTLHLWVVGLWIGAALWHNGVAVPALARNDISTLRPVVRRFQRFVPLLVVVVLIGVTHVQTPLTDADH